MKRAPWLPVVSVTTDREITVEERLRLKDAVGDGVRAALKYAGPVGVNWAEPKRR